MRTTTATCQVFRLPDGRYAVQGTEVWPTGIVGPEERTVILDPAAIAEAIAADRQNTEAKP